jgi:hypothetical protein
MVSKSSCLTWCSSGGGRRETGRVHQVGELRLVLEPAHGELGLEELAERLDPLSAVVLSRGGVHHSRGPGGVRVDGEDQAAFLAQLAHGRAQLELRDRITIGVIGFLGDVAVPVGEDADVHVRFRYIPDALREGAASLGDVVLHAHWEVLGLAETLRDRRSKAFRSSKVEEI